MMEWWRGGEGSGGVVGREVTLGKAGNEEWDLAKARWHKGL